MQKSFSFGDLVQCASAAAERVCFDTEVLKHRDKEVAQRFVLIAPEGEVLAVLETATSKKDRQVRVVVRVGIPHVAAEQDHRAVQQPDFAFTGFGKLSEQLVEQHHLLMVGVDELLDFRFGLPMVAEVMVAVGCVLVGVQFEGRSREGIDNQGAELKPKAYTFALRIVARSRILLPMCVFRLPPFFHYTSLSVTLPAMGSLSKRITPSSSTMETVIEPP